MDETFEYAGMSEPVRGVARDEDVDIARVLLAAAVAPHDLDPEVGVDVMCGPADEFEELAALVARDARDKIVVKLDPNLV